MQAGKVVLIENTAVTAPSDAPSSANAAAGASTGGTTTTGSNPAVVTVRFADGTQHTYTIDEQPGNAFAVGDPVKVISVGEGVFILSQ